MKKIPKEQYITVIKHTYIARVGSFIIKKTCQSRLDLPTMIS